VDTDEAAGVALVFKLDDARDLREQGVVFADPTLTPGLNFVPRWRTRIDPPLTSWPPNRFTPDAANYYPGRYESCRRLFYEP
jgi:hypothetical protein